MSNSNDHSAPTNCKKPRNANWSKKDACILVELYEPYHAVIVGAFSSTTNVTSKSESWQKLHLKFNNAGVDDKRSETEIQNKISNIKDDTRKYGALIRKHKTGGGPPVNEAPLFVQKMFDIMFGSTGDSLIGIQSGVESGTGTSNLQPINLNSGNDVSCVFNNSLENEKDVQLIQQEEPFAAKKNNASKAPTTSLMTPTLKKLKIATTKEM
ncbi:uncharacterized protein LOC136073188 [Hydra vulgaris]|uniref:uncharacterized protein LOC136073188 n=1 Tax=Hydra vulgaris TaxID=6087 RepID=UPI0032E9C65D